MKKLLISLFALAALSGAAYASDYGSSNGDSGSYICSAPKRWIT